MRKTKKRRSSGSGEDLNPPSAVRHPISTARVSPYRSFPWIRPAEAGSMAASSREGRARPGRQVSHDCFPDGRIGGGSAMAGRR